MNEEYTFKNLSDVETVENPSDGATVVGFNNGEVSQFPIGSIGGGVFIIDTNSEDYNPEDTAYGNKIAAALIAGKTVWMYGSNSTTTVTPNANTYRMAVKLSIQLHTVDVHPDVLIIEFSDGSGAGFSFSENLQL